MSNVRGDESVLTPELLARIRERAPGYDAANSFFTEDLAELRTAGYLAPRSLERASADQRLLAAHAPATALGLTMHLVWMGVARDLAAAGDDSLQWVLDDAAAGEVFAFAISERGNDRVMSDSLTRVDRVEATDGHSAGWSFTGTKIFTTLSPAWTRLGMLGRHDPADGTPPSIVHGFLRRDDPTAPLEGVTIDADWDTLGMRATQSYTTHLDGAIVADDRVARILPVGPSADPYMLAVFANFLTLISSVYAGIADRALELAVESAHRRTSMKADGAPYAHDPDIRWRVADAAIALDALAPQLQAVARDRDAGLDRGTRWFRDLSGLKQRSVQTARDVVDQCMHIAGGGGYTTASELSRLQRDVLAGIYHPSDPESVHATVATDLLGPLP
jgi:alkylation response protein AidB-like acyl-CoA dehydrogenase